MGLFTPKWKSKNPDKRLKWIEDADINNTEHQKILAILAKRYEVTLTPKIVSEKITAGGKEVQYEWVGDEKEYLVRREAIKKINDQTVIAEAARFDDNISVRQAALEKLTDSKILAKIARSETDTDLRLIAVKKLTGQSILIDVAKNDKDYQVRIAAVELLTDQSVLSGISKKDKNYLVRKTAYIKLGLTESKESLADIAKNDPDNYIRLTAYRKMGLEESPEALALKEKYERDLQPEPIYYKIGNITYEDNLGW